MRHLKFLSSLLFLVASHQSFSLVFDNFIGASDSGAQIAVDESDLVVNGYAITRAFGSNISCNTSTRFISYAGDRSDYIQYSFTSPLGMLNLSKNSVIRVTFAPDTDFGTRIVPGDVSGPLTLNPFSISVELKDRDGKFLSSSNQLAVKNPDNVLSFDFSGQFSQVAKFTPPSFNYNSIKEVYINLNSTASERAPNVAEFEISRIELVEPDPVPEPISMLTLGTGIAALIQKRRKRK